jgi:aspartate 1-decarboxylase
MRCFVSAKLHNLCVTGASVAYHGSVSIAADLLAAVAITPYEQVHVINLATGHRWITYAVPAPAGVFTLNGGGARLGAEGDRCVVLAYRQEESFSGARVVYCTEDNQIAERLDYAP